MVLNLSSPFCATPVWKFVDDSVQEQKLRIKPLAHAAPVELEHFVNSARETPTMKILLVVQKHIKMLNLGEQGKLV